MPYGYLTRHNGEPYELSVQKMVPGREELTQDDFEKVLTDNGTRIEDGLAQVPFLSANLWHKSLIKPLHEDLLKYVSKIL